MISQLPDRSDVYCGSFMKGTLERVWSEIHANSVFSRIIDEYNPRGVNQGPGFGRISTKKLRTWSNRPMLNTIDGVNSINRILDTGNGIKYRVAINRGSDSLGANGYKFNDTFSLYLNITDTDMINAPYVRSECGKLSFQTRSVEYQQGDDFLHFCIGLVQHFNTAVAVDVIRKRCEDRKNAYLKIKAAASRF